MNYEVNKCTYAIVPIDYNKSKVYENDDEYVISSNPYAIMEHSCEYFGSSLEGRICGSKKILGTIYKSPLLVEEYNNLVFFPTKCISLKEENAWVSLNNIASYEEAVDKKTVVYFKNGKKIVLDIPYLSFENQLLRAARLESVLRQRHFS